MYNTNTIARLMLLIFITLGGQYSFATYLSEEEWINPKLSSSPLNMDSVIETKLKENELYKTRVLKSIIEGYHNNLDVMQVYLSDYFDLTEKLMIISNKIKETDLKHSIEALSDDKRRALDAVTNDPKTIELNKNIIDSVERNVNDTHLSLPARIHPKLFDKQSLESLQEQYKTHIQRLLASYASSTFG